MSGAPNKWTQIQVQNKKVDNMSDVEIDLEENEEGGNNEGGNEQTNDRNSGGSVQAPKENQNSQARTEVGTSKKENASQGAQVEKKDDDEEGEGQGQSRRARRIRFLSTENEKLRNQLAEAVGRVGQVQNDFQRTQNANVVQQKKFYEARIKEKETEYENAVQANDAKAQAKALRELNDAQINHKVYEAAEADIPDEQEEPQQRQQQQVQRQAPTQAPEAATKWVERNKWFMSNQAAHMAARAVNAQLYQEGYDPNSEDYYQELDSRLEEGGLDLKRLRGEQPQQQQAQTQQRRKSPVGSSEGDQDANMGGNKRTQFVREGNKVKVNPSKDDYEMAENLGVPIENYMKNKLIYEEHGEKGYVPVVIRGKN